MCLIHIRSDTINDPLFQERLCTLKLVYTTSSIIQIPITFPIRSDLAAGCEFTRPFVGLLSRVVFSDHYISLL